MILLICLLSIYLNLWREDFRHGEISPYAEMIFGRARDRSVVCLIGGDWFVCEFRLKGSIPKNAEEKQSNMSTKQTPPSKQQRLMNLANNLCKVLCLYHEVWDTIRHETNRVPVWP